MEIRQKDMRSNEDVGKTKEIEQCAAKVVRKDSAIAEPSWMRDGFQPRRKVNHEF
jgi:hypothetical protein